jgi:hypothetical protein
LWQRWLQPQGRSARRNLRIRYRFSIHLETGAGGEAMGKGKMSGDDSAQSKRGLARGSGGTTKKSQNPGKQSNTKAANTKTNRQ